MLSPAPSPRRHRQRGNAMVETALIILPLFALMFAIIDFSLAIFVKSTLQHAVREGVRYAVTFQTQPGLCHDDSIKNVVVHNSLNFLRSEQNREKIQIRYFLPDTLSPSGNNNPGNIVEVSVEGYNWGWIAPLWRTNTPLSMLVRSSDRMEGLPGGSSAPCRTGSPS
jgi:hypothetical protein